MCSGVRLRRCAMRTAAGECGDESTAARRFNGARTQVMHVLVARSARSGRALSESARPTTSLIGTVMPYAERGHVCVRCMNSVLLCVSQAVGALAISLATMVGHFWARKKSILSTQTFLSLFRLSGGATRRTESQRRGNSVSSRAGRP